MPAFLHAGRHWTAAILASMGPQPSWLQGCGQDARVPACWPASRRYFKQHRSTYYERLQAMRDAGDWEGWLAFFLRGVAEVSGQAAETARRILLLREAHRALIAEHLGRAAGNGHRVLEYLYDHPIVSVNEVEALTGVTYAAANQLVGKLEACGILHEFTGGSRNRRFRYEEYIRLFADPEPELQEAVARRGS